MRITAAKRNLVKTNNRLSVSKNIESFTSGETLVFFIYKSFSCFNNCNGNFFNFGKENNVIL